MSMAPNFTRAPATGKISIASYQHSRTKKPYPQIFPVISVKTIFALLILRGSQPPCREAFTTCVKLKQGTLMGLVKD